MCLWVCYSLLELGDVILELVNLGIFFVGDLLDFIIYVSLLIYYVCSY